MLIDWVKLFSKIQEATRKDVEQAFGVLQARFWHYTGPLKNVAAFCFVFNHECVYYFTQHDY